jgi:hypothetical protein
MELAKITVYFKNRSLIKLLLDTIPWKSFYEEKFDFFNSGLAKFQGLWNIPVSIPE